MLIQTKIDVSGLTDKSYKAQKNLVYSAVQGINFTAKKIQQAQRENLRDKLILRTAQTQSFLERNVAVIRPFASVPQGRLYAEVAIAERKKLLLSGLETGAERKPVKGSLIPRPVAGSPARPTKAASVPEQFTFRRMALKAVCSKNKDAAGDVQYKGKQRTFSIKNVGIFQRTGADELKLLYDYEKQQTLPKRLSWMRTARDVAERWLSSSIKQAFDGTLPRI